MRLYHSTLLLFIIPMLVFAQGKNVPGYMGKRFNLQYQMFLWPSFNNPNNSEAAVGSDGYTDVSTSLNMQHHIVGGFSITKQIDLIADVSFANTNFDPYYNLYELDPSNLKYPGMSAMGGAVGIRIYAHHFAPLGSHITFKVGYTHLQIESLSYTLRADDFNPAESYTIEGGTKGAPTITTGFGNNRIIADRIVVNYGIDFTFFAGGVRNWKAFFMDEPAGDYIYYRDGNSMSNQTAYLKKASARYAMHCAVNLKLGIGLLL